MSKVIAVTSGKGGVGKSSISVCLANSYANAGKKALILELDLGLRCIDIMLGVENNVVFDLSDVIKERCSLNDSIIECEKNKNLFYIPAPEKFSFRYDSHKLIKIITSLKENYDIIIVDMPAGLSGFETDLLSQKHIFDIILIITTPDPISIRDAQKTVLLLEELRYDNYKLIINSVEKHELKKLKIRDLDIIIDMIGAQLIGVITYSNEYKLSLAEGIFLDPKHLLSKVFSAICKRIDGEYIPLIIHKL